jgi:hypothetical protein
VVASGTLAADDDAPAAYREFGPAGTAAGRSFASGFISAVAYADNPGHRRTGGVGAVKPASVATADVLACAASSARHKRAAGCCTETAIPA